MKKVLGFGVLVLALMGSAFGQAPKNLAEYLAKHPWNVETDGPMLVIEPDRANVKGPVVGISSFERKKVKLGAITAIVPLTMIVIDDSLRQSPNVFEGLATTDKVIYLLRSLHGDQWRKVSSSGIGMNDLEGEQKLVFESLLPKPFAYNTSEIGPNGSWGKYLGSTELSDSDRSGVHLKVERSVVLGVFMADNHGMSFLGTDQYRGKQGDRCYTRDMRKEVVPKSAFGVDVRQEVENKLKPSQLDYASPAYAKKVSVPEETTVQGILNVINGACGIEVIADFRVADRKVTFAGKEAPVADLLQAIALSVEGTYRRVGSAFVLTSDLIGMGTRKYRLASWQRQVEAAVHERSLQWQIAVGAQPGFKDVAFDSSIPVAPNQAVSDLIDKEDNNDGARASISADQLTPELKSYLDQWDVMYTSQPIRKDKVNLSSNYVYRFILPNGNSLMPEGSFGSPGSFKPHPPRAPRRFQEDPPSLPIQLESGTRLAFRAAAEDASSAARIVKAVAEFPGCELWLDTNNAEVLASALQLAKASGIHLGWLVHPWRTVGEDHDMNIAGEFGPQLAQKFRDQPNARLDGTPLMVEVYTWLSPTSDQVNLRWNRYREMASLEGLRGVMLMETQPYGYEPDRADWQSMFGPLDWAKASHGYTERQRLAFLRQEAIDPIDIGDTGYSTTPDLRQTYFFDDGLRGMPSMYDGTDDTNPKTREVGKRWRSYLAKLNRDAIERLGAMLGSTSLFMEPRWKQINSLPAWQNQVVEWKPGSPIPISDQVSGASQQYASIYLAESPLLSGAYDTRALKTYFASKPEELKGTRLLLDVQSIPPQRLGATLARWFKVKP